MRLRFPSETTEEAEERDTRLFREVNGSRNWDTFERLAGDIEDKGFTYKGLKAKERRK